MVNEIPFGKTSQAGRFGVRRAVRTMAALIVFSWSASAAAQSLIPDGQPSSQVASVAEVLDAPLDHVLIFIDPVKKGLRRDPTPAERQAMILKNRNAPRTGHLPPLQFFLTASGVLSAEVPPDYMVKRHVRLGHGPSIDDVIADRDGAVQLSTGVAK